MANMDFLIEIFYSFSVLPYLEISAHRVYSTAILYSASFTLLKKFAKMEKENLFIVILKKKSLAMSD